MRGKRRLRQELSDLRAELERRTQEGGAQASLLTQVLATVRQGIIVIDPDDSIPYFNPAASSLIRPGSSLSELSPHSLQSLVRRTRSATAPTERLLELDRPHRLLAAVATPIEGSGRVLVVVDDVTEARRIEAIRRDFVAAASHELKTPVASMVASAETLLLAFTRDLPSAERFAHQVERSARQLAGLVADLLDLSRIEAQPKAEQDVALDQVVKEEVASLAGRAMEAGVQLTVQACPTIVRGSPPDLALALRNLVDNALRHTPGGGEVKVVVTHTAEGVRLDVVDNGEGIATRELPRIFERFYRVDPARSRATGGTGLGLAIVRHVVESHGGKVEVRSALGEGSTFSIHLPSRDASPSP
ncbi:MAG TPA: ATP-binding protein [Acidimicrobiia bacterium]|nr:ATP-binding protein [Acidimicrobiia bacterium]